ncbi:MAG: hypothetical protein QF570_18185 [Myxococcota bacterium]|jgi:hypothetical protein|nr:hypothetical protein [Myxococcota bacterium]
MKLRAMIALSSAALLTLVFTLVSVAGPPVCGSDPDGDGACDSLGQDNCTAVANPGQRDDDEDGYGNICDWDVNQDCAIGGPDLAPTFARLFDASPWVPKESGAYDINEDNVIGGPDLAAIFANTFGAPGPTSRACGDCNAAAGTGICP